MREGIAFEGCPGRGETQNSSSIFRKIRARGLTTPENQQAELDRLILQPQELSKHVAMQHICNLNGPLGGWDERGAGLVSPEAVVSLLATAMWLQGAFVSREAGHRCHLFTFLSLQKSASPSGNLHFG